MISAALLATLIVAGDSVLPDSARTLSAPPWWEAGVVLSAESFASRLTPWQWHTGQLRYRGRVATHAVELFTVRRHARANAGFALEETRALPGRAYVTVRAQFAPGADIIARSDVSAELFQALGRAWEFNPYLRLMSYESGSVPVLGMGVARYVGAWYLRGRVSGARLSGRNGYTTSASARRYFADSPTDLVEASAAVGHEVTTLSPAVVDLRRTSDLVLRGQKMLTRGLGMSLGFTYSTNESLPDRRGATLGAFVRW